MTELEISSIAGPALDLLSRNTRGVVLGATERAAFIKFDQSVVTIAPEGGGPRMPNEITIRGPLVRRDFQPRTTVDVTPGTMHSTAWMIAWDGMSVPVWWPNIAAGNVAPEDMRLRGWWILERCGMKHDRQLRHPSEYIFSVDPSLKDLRRARDTIGRCFTELRPTSSNCSLADVIGCGAGLTPSGDDFVCALLLARRAWTMDRYPNFHSLGEVLSQTSTLSATLLTLANEGMALEPLPTLLEVNATQERLQQSLGQLLMMGHSTGLMYAVTIGAVGISMTWDSKSVGPEEERCL